MTEVDELTQRSVQHFEEDAIPGGSDSTHIFYVGARADTITPWGTNPKYRDKELRGFITTESTFASALGIVCARNAAFSWNVEGPPRKSQRAREILDTAHFGRGWVYFASRLSIDLYTQDSGAFVEIIRQNPNSPDSPVIGIANLDAANCYSTGNPEIPVIYVDNRGEYHALKWFQVQHILEMPAPSDYARDLQYCALTRLFRAAQILKDVSIYISEKVGGRHSRAIIGAQGITSKQMEEAIDAANQKANSMGLMRYSAPIVVGSKDPAQDVEFKMLELSSIPDNFDLDLTYKQYIAQIAMAFLSDYQEFAPLPGGNLGSASQSEILHRKTQGKGPALFQSAVETMLNWYVLPEDVEMRFHEQDSEEEKLRAELANQRAETRATRIESSEISTTVARMIALEEGDLDEAQFEQLQQEDKEREQQQEDTLESGSPVVDDADTETESQSSEDAPDSVGSDAVSADMRRRAFDVAPDPDYEPVQDRLAFEDLVTERVEEAFRRARIRARERMDELLTRI